MALIDDALRKERRGAEVAGFFSVRRRPLAVLLAAAFFIGCCVAALAVRWTFGREMAMQAEASRDYKEMVEPLKGEGPSGREEPPAAESPAPSPAEQVLLMPIQGVQVGPYETKALIGGRLVRQGERVGPLIFLGMRGRELAFEDGAGEKYYRPVCPADGQ